MWGLLSNHSQGWCGGFQRWAHSLGASLIELQLLQHAALFWALKVVSEVQLWSVWRGKQHIPDIFRPQKDERPVSPFTGIKKYVYFCLFLGSPCQLACNTEATVLKTGFQAPFPGHWMLSKALQGGWHNPSVFSCLTATEPIPVTVQCEEVQSCTSQTSTSPDLASVGKQLMTSGRLLVHWQLSKSPEA